MALVNGQYVTLSKNTHYQTVYFDTLRMRRNKRGDQQLESVSYRGNTEQEREQEQGFSSVSEPEKVKICACGRKYCLCPGRK